MYFLEVIRNVNKMERVFNRPFSNGPLPINLIITMRKQVATGNGGEPG